MTVIAGFTDGKTCAIAGDSGLFEIDKDGANTGVWWPAKSPKVWRAGNFLLGGSGTYTPLVLAEESKVGDPFKLAAFLKERKENFASDDDWDIMVVGRRGLWMVWQGFTVERIKLNYHACGDASSPAFGALALAKQLKLSPLEAVKAAVQASCDHHIGARPPVAAKEIK
jgi:hypothetical protein